MTPLLLGTATGGSFSKQSVAPYASLAPLYDILLGDRFFPLLRTTFERLSRRYGIRCHSAADVACGTGLFVRYLCARGVPEVYGVDRSAAMLRVASKKSRHTNADFLHQEFATLRLPRPVDLITCNFDSLNYLLDTAELLHAFRRFGDNLKPSGQLIFDMITDRPLWPHERPYVERVTGSGFTFRRIMRRERYSPIQRSSIAIALGDRTHREMHVQRGYPAATVIALLDRSGLELLGAHDFQTLGAVRPQTSRVVYIARSMS
jgi:SAM-dependent methyltransferase